MTDARQEALQRLARGEVNPTAVTDGKFVTPAELDTRDMTDDEIEQEITRLGERLHHLKMTRQSRVIREVFSKPRTRHPSCDCKYLCTSLESHAEASGKVCGSCGRAFTDEDTVYLTSHRIDKNRWKTWGRVPVCESCWEDRQERGLFLYNGRGASYLKPETCEGCGRRVMLRIRDYGHCRVYCSRQCASAIGNARRRQPVPSRTCAACDTEYQPKRRDARYCSGRCRQKAHRRRNGSHMANAVAITEP